MVGVVSGSLYRRTHSLSRLAWSWVGKGKRLDTCYSATYMSQTLDQQRFTISEVAAVNTVLCCLIHSTSTAAYRSQTHKYNVFYS